jgi:L1 cell adhesion molecule like protein
LDKCNEVVRWIDSNQLAEKEEFDHQLKDLEKLCMPEGGGSGPTIEEVD